MCGIFCCLRPSDCVGTENSLEKCENLLKRRGPDEYATRLVDLDSGWKLSLAASVLWTQGDTMCKQPCDASGNILCWNGDVFGGPLGVETSTSRCSDTEVVSTHLLSCSLNPNLLIAALGQITGPYSMIYFNERAGTIWLGRDPVGRHSLLWGFSEEFHCMTVSSVAPSTLSYMKEMPALGLFEVYLPTSQYTTEFTIKLHPWFKVDEDEIMMNFNGLPISVTVMSPILKDHIFSFVIHNQEPTAMDLRHLSEISPDWTAEEIMENLIKDERVFSNVSVVLSLLEAAINVRICKKSPVCQQCFSAKSFCNSRKNMCTHAKVAVLFSGGLDSALLAALAHQFIPEDEPIDLLNVAFEKRKVGSHIRAREQRSRDKHQKKLYSGHSTNDDGIAVENVYDVPDRLTGRKTLEELQKLYPNRKWNFIEIDVTHSDLEDERSKHISHLIYPLNTVLDDSLGCAVWFAARGHGRIFGSDEMYLSSARIVLLGMGADEQFGGYMRHRTALKNHGWSALQSVLQEDLRRIPSRNLGRDNRVTSDHGRQSRLPYLDESFMNFVRHLPPWEKCCPDDRFPCGIGDKMLLRLAAWHIGLRGAALLPKRAMQFGSKIANSKENAAHVSIRL